MTFCEECGATMPEGAVFCEACGASQECGAQVAGAAQGGGAADPVRAPVYSKAGLVTKTRNEAARRHNAGADLYKAGHYREAIAEFDQAIALCPDVARFYAFRGGAREKLKDYTGAEADFDRAERLEPDNPAHRRSKGLLHHSIGMDLYKQDHYREAIAEFDQAIAQCPDEAVFWGNAASAWHNLEDNAKALEHYRKALEFNPEQAMYRNNVEVLEGEVKKADKKPGLFGKGGKGKK